MKNYLMNSYRTALMAFILSFLASTVSCVTVKGPERYLFYGGPDGGTFTKFAKGISDLAASEGLNLCDVVSAGSLDNLRKIDSGKADFAIAYASHVYQARHGLLTNDFRKYQNITVLGYFYGAPAQLVVRKDSGIKSASQLAGKKISVGHYRSGSSFQAETFFKTLGVWDKLDRIYMGYNESARKFANKELDAFWLFTAYPSGAVVMAADMSEIDLIQVGLDGEKANLFRKYPYFAKTTIPPGVYKGGVFIRWGNCVQFKN